MNWVISGIRDAGAALRPAAARGARGPDSSPKSQLFPARAHEPASLLALPEVLGLMPCWTVSFSGVGVGADISCTEPMRSTVVTAGCGEGGGTGTAVSLRVRVEAALRPQGKWLCSVGTKGNFRSECSAPTSFSPGLRFQGEEPASATQCFLQAGHSLFSKF